LGGRYNWQASIVRNEGVIDDDTRMSYLVARVNDPYNLSGTQTGQRPDLAFGSFVVARIEGRKLDAAARIPRSLVKNNEVPVYHDGKLQLKPVTVLRHIDGESVVTEGVASGDLLVTTSLEYPVAGMALERFDQRVADKPATDPAVAPAAVDAPQQGER
tara:strand:- start:1598 stop:2074 length:477 start_codon:yes stop_codon:yes gene_type:complete